MSDSVTVREVIEELEKSRRSVRCSRLEELLRSLGFEVREGKKGGHRLVFHDRLVDFSSTSFDGGHGRNPEVKPAYISQILRVLRKHEAEL